MALFQVSLRRSKKIRQYRDRGYIKLPVLGQFYRLSQHALICQILATTLSAGLATDRAIQLCQQLCQNQIYQQALAHTLKRLSIGHPLHQALQTTRRFPAEMILLTAVGEDSAQLPKTFAHLAHAYQQQLDHHMTQLSSILEPLLMLMMGVVAGGLVIAMYLPIFQMGSTLG